MKKIGDLEVEASAKTVARRLGLTPCEALRGIQYGIELAQKEALDAGERVRARKMGALFTSTIRVGRKFRR